MTKDIIHAAVELVCHAPSLEPRYLNFLRQICGSKERPMPNNQNWLVSEIMDQGNNNVYDILFEGVYTNRTWVIQVRRKGTATTPPYAVRPRPPPQSVCTALSAQSTRWLNALRMGTACSC